MSVLISDTIKKLFNRLKNSICLSTILFLSLCLDQLVLVRFSQEDIIPKIIKRFFQLWHCLLNSSKCQVYPTIQSKNFNSPGNLIKSHGSKYQLHTDQLPGFYVPQTGCSVSQTETFHRKLKVSMYIQTRFLMTAHPHPASPSVPRFSKWHSTFEVITGVMSTWSQRLLFYAVPTCNPSYRPHHLHNISHIYLPDNTPGSAHNHLLPQMSQRPPTGHSGCITLAFQRIYIRSSHSPAQTLPLDSY